MIYKIELPPPKYPAGENNLSKENGKHDGKGSEELSVISSVQLGGSKINRA